MGLLNWIILALFMGIVIWIAIRSDGTRKRKIEKGVAEILTNEWVCIPGGERQSKLPFASELPRESKAFSRQVPLFYRISDSDPTAWLFGNITERADASSVMGNSIMMVKKADWGEGFSFRVQQKQGGVFEDVEDRRFSVYESVKLKDSWFICDLLGCDGGGEIGKYLLDEGVPSCVRMVQLSGGYLVVSGESAYRPPDQYIELLNAAEKICLYLDAFLSSEPGTLTEPSSSQSCEKHKDHTNE